MVRRPQVDHDDLEVNMSSARVPSYVLHIQSLLQSHNKGHDAEVLNDEYLGSVYCPYILSLDVV